MVVTTTNTPPTNRVELPFVCPVCASANAVHLISLSRAGGMECGSCARWLRATDVMRAMHSPREAREGAPPAVQVTTRSSGVARKDRIAWPPTAETRASATPLRVARK